MTMHIMSNIHHNHHYLSAKLCKQLYYNEEVSKKTQISKNSDNTTYIAIKGTSSVRDWKQNINFKLNERNIHTGFEEYAIECNKELNFNKLLIDELNENRKLVIASHSLGASACIILMYDFLRQNEQIDDNDTIDVVLLGCPKTGGQTFIDDMKHLLKNRKNIELFRYVTKYDIVPMYPPLKEYVHIENELLLNGYDAKINAHSIETYLDNLRELRSSSPESKN